MAWEKSPAIALVSLVVTDERKPRQETRPEKDKPIEIPVSKRGQVMNALRRAMLRRTSTSR
jgi:hypothetical protein